MILAAAVLCSLVAATPARAQRPEADLVRRAAWSATAPAGAR